MFFEFRKYPPVGAPLSRRVRIHPRYPRGGKEPRGLALDLLRADTEIPDIPALAFGAFLRWVRLIVAIMAIEPPGVEMIRHGDIAVPAGHDIAALPAVYKSGEIGRAS